MPLEGAAEVIGGGIAEPLGDLAEGLARREQGTRMLHSPCKEMLGGGDAVGRPKELREMGVGVAEARKLLKRADVEKVGVDIVDDVGQRRAGGERLTARGRAPHPQKRNEQGGDGAVKIVGEEGIAPEEFPDDGGKEAGGIGGGKHAPRRCSYPQLLKKRGAGALLEIDGKRLEAAGVPSRERVRLPAEGGIHLVFPHRLSHPVGRAEKTPRDGEGQLQVAELGMAVDGEGGVIKAFRHLHDDVVLRFDGRAELPRAPIAEIVSKYDRMTVLHKASHASIIAGDRRDVKFCNRKK